MTDPYVLVVDDDPHFSRFTHDLLTGNDMRVVVAASKAEGLAEFERERPSCVILDIFLPDGSGVDLIRPMRAASHTMPIIMVSGQSEVDEVVRAMKEGASDYVKKPFQGEELLLKMQMVLDASHAKVELDELRIKTRPEEEYNLLFGMSDRMSKVQAVLDQVASQARRLPDAVRERVHLFSLPMNDLQENAAIVNALQRRADVVVQKSLAEGFGLTVAEAMWKTRPVVASAVGGIVDQIAHREHGLLLDDPHDLAAFGAAVESLLRDPAEAARLGRNARERATRELLGDTHLLHYADLLAKTLARA